MDLNEDPIDINSSDHLRSGWDKSPKETESAYSIAFLLYPVLSSNDIIKLDDFFLQFGRFFEHFKISIIALDKTAYRPSL